MGELSGRVAIITGGAMGIGKATARVFADQGANVVIIDIDESNGSLTVDEIRAAGGTAALIAGSVTDRKVLETALKFAVTEFGKLDTLVNNAGVFVMRGINGTPTEWMKSLEGNVIAYAMTAQVFAPALSEAGSASIVNVCSISAHIAQEQFWTYSSAKGAVHTLTKCMALDLAPKIRVNSVSPGTIWTESNQEFMSKNFGYDRIMADAAPEVGGLHLLKRCGDPVEVANAISFLSSTRASFITGTDLIVDGGYTTR